MHRDFREHLDAARGIAEFVVAINLDIRGFSAWSLTVDSAQTALFIKKIYAKLIDTYFADASLVKPTGDGLLVVKMFDEPDLQEVVSVTVKDAIRIVETFGSLCDDDDMVNFDVPQDMGIGIARGSACRLASDDFTLDYSGRVLNLASRLMELARPRGVILDSTLGATLLPADIRARFSSETVYLKGVSPDDPTQICYWPADIEIPESCKHPLGEKRWSHTSMTTTRRQLEQSDAPHYRFLLDPQPIVDHDAECSIEHAAVTPGKRKSRSRTKIVDIPVEMVESAGRKSARIDQRTLGTMLKAAGVGPTWEVKVRVSYRTM